MFIPLVPSCPVSMGELSWLPLKLGWRSIGTSVRVDVEVCACASVTAEEA